ncbi:MAG: GNAT family N-acetyltransferase [Phycisphaerales bacterium]|nr:GNAT family N-acetyltransferase [Phycisphaerales bacterium]
MKSCVEENTQAWMREIKCVSVVEAFRHIVRGTRIFIGSGAAAPLTLIEAMDTHSEYFVDHEVVSILTEGPAPYATEKHALRFRYNALFIGGNVRGSVEAGHADYTPIFLSEIPRMFKDGQMPIGVAMIQVAPPRDGMCSLGVSVDVVKAAAESADMIIAEVNPQMPFTVGDSCIPANDIDYFILGDHAIPELRARPITPENKRIGKNIAKLVDDGSTIQAGIGAIPDAALSMLKDKKDLGVHTEMMSDGFVDLIEQGVVTNRFKKKHKGKSVTSFMLGTKRLYDFVRDRDDIECYPCDYTNDPYVIGQIDKMVAINTAVEVDLTGQVCSDSIGARFYSGIGGQVDFIRGAARSKGGKPIIALPSTAKNGTVSRIKPRLQRGGGVVTTRGDVHYVVTEWGIASLHGKTVRERAMALIEIAHPKFRPWLLAEAKQHKYVYADQADPPITMPIYPQDLEFYFKDRNGVDILIRPVRISDEDQMHDLFYSMSDESLYQRFFAYTKSVPHASLQNLCVVDYHKSMALVASVGDMDSERIIGMARYVHDKDTGFAEAEFAVADEYQNRGTGSTLILKLAEVAKSNGIKGFVADVLSNNAQMLHLFGKLGGRHESLCNQGIYSLKIWFDEEAPT